MSENANSHFQCFLDNKRSDTLLKLAHTELMNGNYSGAEHYFKSIIEVDNDPAAWVGLGSTKLAYLFENNQITVNEANKLLNSAFYSFRQAKEISPEHAETIEKRILTTSFNQLKVYYEWIKKFYDAYTHSQKQASNMTYLGIAAVLFKSPVMGHVATSSYIDHKVQGNTAAEQLNLYVQIAIAVRDNTIKSIEEAIDARNAFIKEISAIEHEVGWYITDEKEKKRILAEQEKAKRRVTNNKNATTQSNKPAMSPVIKLIIFVAIVLIIIRLIEMFNN